MSFEQTATLVVASASIATAIIAWIAILSQRRQHEMNLRAVLLRDFYNEFFNKRHMREVRAAVSQFGIDRIESNELPGKLPAVVFQILDFFDTVAVFYNKKALDPEMAFSIFYYWASHYWEAFHEEARKFESDLGVKVYANISPFVKDLSETGRRMGRISNNFQFSPENLRYFFSEEIE